MFQHILILSAALLCLIFPLEAHADIVGKVIAISDGDTVKVLTNDHKQHKVRLAEIDTPEKGQPYGQKAKDALSLLIFGKAVRVEEVTTDRYGRLVGHIYLNDLHINKEMVRIGAAWAYRQYLKDQSFIDIENTAKADQRGIWGLSEAQRVPPWDWRRGKKVASPSPTSGEYKKCGTKTYCRDMRDCAEARYFLTQCGLGRLDGDKDGMPCEALCR
jgi:endonuclease YncB( thermonuclease family)